MRIEECAIWDYPVKISVVIIIIIIIIIIMQIRPFKPWPNGLASRCKCAKPELAYGLAMDGQTGSKLNAS